MIQDKNDELIQIEFKNVKLDKASKKATRKIKDSLWGNVCNAIECPYAWHMPCKNHKYSVMKKTLEDGFKDFFKLSIDVVVEDFDTNIIEYD